LVNFLYRQRRKNKLLEDVYAFINSNKDRNVFVKVYINEHIGKKVNSWYGDLYIYTIFQSRKFIFNMTLFTLRSVINYLPA